MKLNIIIFLLVFSLLLPYAPLRAATTYNNLKGRILLQVESHGEAWYVNPEDGQRKYMADGNAAYALMRSNGIGISNKDLNKIPVATNFIDNLAKLDSDNDGYNDKQELQNGYNPNSGGKLVIDKSFVNPHKGKIFLQVESHGEAWYINPVDGLRYYLGTPSDAFNIMRSLGLGITNKDLDKIAVNNIVEKNKNPAIVKDQPEAESNLSLECEDFPNNLDSCTKYSCNFTHPFTGDLMKKEIFGIVDGKCRYVEEMPNNGQMECNYSESLRKAAAQYYNDLAKSQSSRTLISFGGTQDSIKYYIDGKEVSNPLQEALNNGACVVSGYDDSSTNNDSNLNGNLEIEWGTFIKAKDSSDNDLWRMPIKITNNENKMVVLDINGVGKERNWDWQSEQTLESGESDTFDFEIDHYFFDKTAFDKKYIKISAYECNKLSIGDAANICLSEWGFDGKKSPWEVLKSKKDAGTPINPTLVSEKYFNFNSITVPPSEISKEEYLK